MFSYKDNFMKIYKECLQIVEDNNNNPHPKIFFITMCLLHWDNRKRIYSNMKETFLLDVERRKLDRNIWGEDSFIEELIQEGYPLENILELVLKSSKIEWEMFTSKLFNRNYLVIPMLEELTKKLLPIWVEEVTKLKIQKDHPEIKQIIYFVLNLRDYEDKREEYIYFFLRLLYENL